MAYQRPPIRNIVTRFQEFARTEASGGVLLLGAAVGAILWANLGGDSYQHFFETEVSLRFGGHGLTKTLHHWINDGLMAIFFLVVGLEIKREMLVGELASLRKSALPIAGALGGMVVPAVIYASLNWSSPALDGWGIPMATDIAFAIGVMALLGDKVPVGVKVFLTALAIVDDLGAVLVIALFYTAELDWLSLALGLLVLGILLLLNLAGVRHPLLYLVFGVALWLAFLKSGVHATVAGVLLAMAVPARSKMRTEDFLDRAERILENLRRAEKGPALGPTTGDEQAALDALQVSSEEAGTPMQVLEHTLQPWSSFLIMPLFALANAGLRLDMSPLSLLTPVSLGVLVGLLFGKPLGITLFSWIAVRLGWADLGASFGWRHILGAGCLGGIGFTMSLFIGNLAFPSGEGLLLAKAGILSASLLAGLAGSVVLSRVSQPAAELAESDVAD